MATILDKDLTRESNVKYDNREIQITLTADQNISFKLKGMKSGVLSIGIENLYKQLAGVESKSSDVEPKKSSIVIKRKTSDDSNPMISLRGLRTKILTEHMDLKMRLQLEAFVCDLLKMDDLKMFDED